MTDLTRNAPSLVMTGGGPGARRVILRGVRASGEPTVGVYFDESPVSGSVGTASDAGGSTPELRLFDVERAEVLRGPQGTLFGSGSMGGTIRIIYEKPKADRWETAVNGKLALPRGGKLGGSLDAMINMPIVEDKLAIRVVGFYNQFPGYIDNIRYDRKNINDGNSFGGRVLVRAMPTERLTADFNIYHEKVKTASSGGEYTDMFGNLLPKYTTNERTESAFHDRSTNYSATVNYDLDFMTLTAVTSYFDRWRANISDLSNTVNWRGYNGPRSTDANPLDGSRLPGGCGTYLLGSDAAVCSADQFASYMSDLERYTYMNQYQPAKVTNWTNEIRLASSGDSPFSWTVGLFSSERNSVVRSTPRAGNHTTGRLEPYTPANILFDRTIDDTLQQKAAFAELSYKLFDKLTLTAGLRYFDYKRVVGGRVDVGSIHFGSRATPYSEVSVEEDGVVKKFNVAYEFNDDVMVYAQAAQGFRPGGANQAIGLPIALSGYTSDGLWNYEVGAKTRLMPGMYFNVTGYQIDWSNMQVSGTTGGAGAVFGFISNAGAARIKGLEVELNTTPMIGFSLSANLGYVDAKLTEDQTSEVLVSVGRKGDRLPGVSKWNLGGQAEYVWAVNENIEGLVRFDASYNSSTNNTLSRTDRYFRQIGGYGLVNFRAGVQSPDGAWAGYLFVDNLLNSDAITGMGAGATSGGIFSANRLQPRTVGINLINRFR